MAPDDHLFLDLDHKKTWLMVKKDLSASEFLMRRPKALPTSTPPAGIPTSPNFCVAEHRRRTPGSWRGTRIFGRR